MTKPNNLQSLEWFKERIGKIIYRDNNGCDCVTCSNVSKSGMRVHDLSHAQYLYDLQNDYAAEGKLLNYRDNK